MVTVVEHGVREVVVANVPLRADVCDPSGSQNGSPQLSAAVSALARHSRRPSNGNPSTPSRAVSDEQADMKPRSCGWSVMSSLHEYWACGRTAGHASSIASIDLYRAVLDEGVRTVDDRRAWSCLAYQQILTR
jgi:hypothetical protein